jgi:hypothetical protein
VWALNPPVQSIFQSLQANWQKGIFADVAALLFMMSLEWLVHFIDDNVMNFLVLAILYVSICFYCEDRIRRFLFEKGL